MCARPCSPRVLFVFDSCPPEVVKSGDRARGQVLCHCDLSLGEGNLMPWFGFTPIRLGLDRRALTKMLVAESSVCGLCSGVIKCRNQNT